MKNDNFLMHEQISDLTARFAATSKNIADLARKNNDDALAENALEEANKVLALRYQKTKDIEELETLVSELKKMHDNLCSVLEKMKK